MVSPFFLEVLENCHPVLLWVWTGSPKDFFPMVVQPEDGRLSNFCECLIHPELLLLLTGVLVLIAYFQLDIISFDMKLDAFSFGDNVLFLETELFTGGSELAFSVN